MITMPDTETLTEEQQLVEVEARELLAYYKSKGMGEPVMVARLANEVKRLRGELNEIYDCDKCDLCEDH